MDFGWHIRRSTYVLLLRLRSTLRLYPNYSDTAYVPYNAFIEK